MALLQCSGWQEGASLPTEQSLTGAYHRGLLLSFLCPLPLEILVNFAKLHFIEYGYFSPEDFLLRILLMISPPRGGKTFS